MHRLSDIAMRQRVSLVQRMSSTLQKRVSTPSRVNTLGYEAFTTLDPIQTHRQQHQLASLDHSHREAMRLFLDSLNAVLISQKNASESLPEKPTEYPQQQSKTPTEMNNVTEDDARISRHMNIQLGRAIRRKDSKKSMSLFEEAIANKHIVDQKHVVSLFYQMSKMNPVIAYDILQYYNLHPETSDIRLDMYRRLCSSISLLDPKVSKRWEINKFIESLLTELEAMDKDVKEELYPNLIASFAAQRSVSIGPFAGVLYNYMIENDYEMVPGWLNKLLAASKYNRQEDLPFHDILARLVAKKQFPHPLSALPAIHNMFPYTDTKQMCVAINALLDTKHHCKNVEDEVTSSLYNEYSIDMATLEMISAGAANAGDTELILLLWDLLDVSGYKPSEHIYENTVITFACSRNGIFQAFSALATMKDEGYDISRALIRSFSRAIRSNRRYVDKAFRLLTNGDSGDLQCPENFNVVMSAYAERGDVNETMRVLNSMKEHGFHANQDSYSFAMEALGKDLHRRKSTTDRSWVHKNIEIASSILTTMEEDGVPPSADVVRNYVELLCMGGELSTATALIEDCMTNDEMLSIVNNKALYRVALANAEAGNFDTAKKLASSTSEAIPILHRKIRSKEQRFQHLESMRKRREREANVT